MRNIKLSIIAIATFLVASCSKESANSPVVNEYTTFTASYESETKTVLNSDKSISWNADDAIKIFTPTQSAKYKTTAGGAKATFEYVSGDSFASSSANYALYPYSDEASISSSTITFTLPATQSYVEGSFGNGANPAVGIVSGNRITFKNICGYLKLSATVDGVVKVKKIVLTTKGAENLCGTFTVDASSSAPVASFKTGASDGGKSITLDCGAGVALSSTAKDFIFVVPVGSFASGFEAVFYNEHDREIKTVSTIKDNTISRKAIKSMPLIALTWLPSGYKELQYLRSTRDQGSYINSGFNADHNSGFEAKFTPGQTGYWENLFSARYTDHNRQFGLNWNSGSSYTYANTGRFEHTASGEKQNNCELTLSSVNTIKYINNQFTSAKGTVSTLTPGSYTAYGPVYIFALNQGGSVSEYCTADLYYLKFYDGSTLDRYFIPVRNSSSDLGLYDVVGKTFYKNAGSGSFTAGEY